jgi:hypothetical protein
MTSAVPPLRVPTVAGVAHHSSQMAMCRLPLGESPDGHDRMDVREQLRAAVGAARRSRVGAPGHIAFDPEGRCAFVACERAEAAAVLDLEARELVDIVGVGGAEPAPSPSPDT